MKCAKREWRRRRRLPGINIPQIQPELKKEEKEQQIVTINSQTGTAITITEIKNEPKVEDSQIYTQQIQKAKIGHEKL